MTLREAVEYKEYIIEKIETLDKELEAFLFTLGCYVGEPVTVIKHLKASSTIAIKDARYNIDKGLAEAITIK